MNLNFEVGTRPLMLGIFFVVLVAVALAYQASFIPAAGLMNPDELVKILKSSKGEKPLMIQVGSHVLFQQAHIPGSEYIGPASSENGLQQLRRRVETLPRSKAIIIYCGCCPWSHCPNVKPAVELLKQMGFTRVKAMFVETNFAKDWTDKGYPVEAGTAKQ